MARRSIRVRLDDLSPVLKQQGETMARRLAADAGRRLRYLGGRLEGWGYRLRGEHPDPGVPDDVLADRIRSQIGPVEKRLDVPHVHVMVHEGVATLHGEVGTVHEAREIEDAVSCVSGVRSVISYIHVGLFAGSTRPSDGRKHRAPSDAWHVLMRAVEAEGVTPAAAPHLVRAVLATLCDRLPKTEREQFLLHLPADVRKLGAPLRGNGSGNGHVRSPGAFAGSVARLGGISPRTAEKISTVVIGELKSLVPEEASDVAASLPAELRAFWEAV